MSSAVGFVKFQSGWLEFDAIKKMICERMTDGRKCNGYIEGKTIVKKKKKEITAQRK